MALQKCLDCDGQVSDKATVCPHCGRPTARAIRSKRLASAGRSLLMVVAILSIIPAVKILGPYGLMVPAVLTVLTFLTKE